MSVEIIQPQTGRVRILGVTTYTPPAATTFTVNGGSTGTQPTFDGDPLFSGHYIKTGDLVHFDIEVDFSNITSFGTGQYYLDLPFTSAFDYAFGSGNLTDGDEIAIWGKVAAGSSRMYLQSIDISGQVLSKVAFTSTVPVTLTTSDSFSISGTYATSE